MARRIELKKITIPLLTLLILSACGNESTEEQLQEAEAHKEELESVLQTEEVTFQRNTLKLESLEDSISQIESEGDNEAVTEYVNAVETYANALQGQIDHLTEIVGQAKEEDDLDPVNDEIDSIIDNVENTIQSYDEDTSELELNESLERKHNELQLANRELPQALESIKNGASSGSMEAMDEGLDMLNDVSEYY